MPEIVWRRMITLPFFSARLMKRTFTVLGAAAAATALLCACSKQEDSIKCGGVQMSITAGLDEGTKTVLGTDGSVTWATSGEKLEVLQVAGTGTGTGTAATAKVSSEGSTSDEGQTMTFAVNFDASEEAPFAYYALYPSTAYVTSSNTNVEKLKVELASSQNPTASSFGVGADLLIAKPVTGLSTQPATLDLQFARIVAVGKMNITDLNSTENVKSVTFTASDKTITGRSYVNLTTGLVDEYGYSSNNNVVLDYSAQSIAANGMTAYFTCWPCKFAKDDTFTVVVETQTKKFTKEVTIPSDDALAFKEGRASAFTVSFSGIEGENVAADLNAAYLSYDEIKDNTGWGASYDTVYSYTQSNGATWTIACNKQSCIQLGNNKGYLKLPDFTENITSVTVTLSEAPKSGNLLLLATSKSATTGDIASLAGDGSKTEFTFDLTEKEVKTAYLRASGAAAKILSVLVIAGEDARAALSTPQNVMADLVTDSANSIEVVWNAVENAGSYVVTATPAEGKAVSKTVTETSCTFTGLAYETEYSISVVAKSSDYTKYTDSATGAAKESVTTLANPSTGDVEVLRETFDDTSTSDASKEITSKTFDNFSGATSKAYKSKYGGIKFGTGSASGYITSKSLDLSSSFTVKINVRQFGIDTGNVQVMVGNVTKKITPTSEDVVYTLDFDAATSTSTVKIGTSVKRAYIDNVIIIRHDN